MNRKNYEIVFQLALYFSTKSKNRLSEYGCVVKIRVFLYAAQINTQTPLNQYNELKHNVTNSKTSAPPAKDLKSRACDMQIDFGNPVDPDEQASNAVCEERSPTSTHLKI